LAKNHSSPYTTQVQIAAPTELAEAIRRRLDHREAVTVVGETIPDGSCLLDGIAISRPDILLLDMALPSFDAPALFKMLDGKRFPPHVVAAAPHYAPYLAQAERYRVVRGTLLHRLAVSPLLPPVLKGIAEGHEYFTPSSALNLPFSDLTPEDTILLALMAVGQQVCDLVHELDCSRHVVYTTQCQLRKKLDVETNEQAILTGIRRKLVAMLTEPDDQATRESA